MFDQAQNAAIRNFLPEDLKQTVFRDRIEVTLQIRVHDVHVTGFEQFFDAPQRVVAAASVAEAEASLVKRGVQDRLDHMHHRRLHDSVANGRDAQRSPFRTARFGNPSPKHRRRTVVAVPQLLAQSVQFLPFVFGKVLNRLPVDSRGPLLAHRCRPSRRC